MTAALLWLGAGVAGLHAQTTVPAPDSGLLLGKTAGDTSYQRITSLPVLYKSAQNPYVQEFALLTQLQLQYASGSDESGNFGSGDFPDALTWKSTEVRRFRLGLKGRFFEKLFFLNLTDLHPDLEPRIYKRTPETYFTWMENDALNISAGKTELKFNREQEYSSKEFLPFERTAVGNMLYGGELTGAWVCGKGIAGGWLYYLGAYSNDREDEWTDFNGGAIMLGKIGYNYTKHTSFDLAEVKFQYLHNTEPGYQDSAACLPSPAYSNCISISNEITEGALGFTAELLWGDGELGRADVCGLSTMTTWSFNAKLQLVGVLELAGSREENGVILPVHFEALSPGVGDKSGDAYFANYAGLNYYLDGQRCKLMSGVKYSWMDGGTGGGDFNGWTWLVGVRTAF